MSDVATPTKRMTLGERVKKFRPSSVTEGAPIYPLMLLFGLNLVDELDQHAFYVLSPDIRDHFGLSIQGILTLTSLVGFSLLFLEIPIAHFADRRSRVKIAAGGASAWGGFALLTGLAPSIPFMAVVRTGAGLGRSVNGATHRSLLADFYDVRIRPQVYAFHSSANAIGQFIAPLSAGLIAFYFGWRAPFIVFAIPTFILVMLSIRMREPVRGANERRLMGANEETALTEEAPASFAEAMRMLWQVRSLRRVWMAVPIVAVSAISLAQLKPLFYAEVLGLDVRQRGFLAAVDEPFQFVGLFVGIPVANRLLKRDPKLLLRFLAVSSVVSAAGTALLIVSRSVWVAVGANIILALVRASLTPALLTIFSLVIPPRVRSVGFSVGAVFAVPAYIAVPIIGRFADSWGLPRAMALLLPVQLLGGFVIATAGNFLSSDIHKVRTATTAMAEVRAARKRGEVKLLLAKDVDVGYDGVQVLFGVDFEVGEGEIVALLGTNGAGKSTLLKSISGLVEAQSGAFVFDGVDMTYAPPHEIVARGVVQVPGGKGVFPTLTVAENLRIAGWLYRRDAEYVAKATEEVLGYFPILRQRWDQPSGNLSGGEQQMLTLGMAFIAKPRLLMIDELSLGLAPIIVEQLLEIVRAIRERGTTIILVEQSVNVALTLAETAYFMEKGEIRFKGPTAELLDRPDILRSVFLEGAGAMAGSASPGAAKGGARTRSVTGPAAKSDDIVLSVEGLSKSYGGVRAVDDVTFSLKQGEILGFIGPNGAGKTTVFDLISGFTSTDTGRVEFGGIDLTGLGPDVRARMGLGRSFQDARLFPGLTVGEAIAVALERTVEIKDPVAAALNLPAVSDSEAKVDERVEEIIELIGLAAFRDKFVGELSTGSRRIVDLGCVLAHDPSVLLFDEPSSGIAQRETEALGPLLLRIREATNASLLVIEHDMPLITSIADGLIALDLGSVIAQGTANEVVNHPKVVESYLGTNQATIARSGVMAPAGNGGRRSRTLKPGNGKSGGDKSGSDTTGTKKPGTRRRTPAAR